MILLAGIGLLASRSVQTDLSDSLPVPTCASQRSMYDIIWGCLATIFACCWVSIHPNMPSSSDPSSIITRRRIELMIWGVVAPEVVILWAMAQWHGARHVANRYRDRGWTETHGHFLQMGGFHLVNLDGKSLGVLTMERFDWLLERQKISFPSITEEDIQDRSKGDSLAKGLVVLQSTWFIVQCIARLVQGLDVTEMELITLAIASLNGLMYFLWWDKPLDARSPVTVYMKMPYNAREDEPILAVDPVGSTMDSSQHQTEMEDYTVLSPSSVTPLLCHPEAAFTLESHRGPHDPHSPITYSGPEAQIPTVQALQPLRRDASDIQLNSTDRSSRSWSLSLVAFIPCNIQIPATLVSVSKVFRKILAMFLVYPFKLLALFVRHSSDRLWDIVNDYTYNITEAMRAFPTTHTRVPTFYAIQSTTSSVWNFFSIRCGMKGTVSMIGALFGAIHCAGWNFTFSSRAEQVIWRLCSVFIASAPLLVAFYFLMADIIVRRCVIQYRLGEIREMSMSNTSRRAVRIGSRAVKNMVPFYIVARLCLLILALTALRSLSVGAYDEVEWVRFIPHI